MPQQDRLRELEDIIDQRIGEVRTEALDLSFGEIVNLHKSGELKIAPEYQRLFRWSEQQQSRLIESILLELPVPQIFVIEGAGGVFELIDGLQRVSSVIRFLEPEALDYEPLALHGCDLIPELNGNTFDDLSLTLRLRLKRASVRVIVIKRQSSPVLRFEMFKRLNTGGSLLTPQEIRNVTARILGETGIRFYEYLQALAGEETFRLCTSTLSPGDRDQKADEELVLRFFAAKNDRDSFRGSVRDWLDDYMEKVILNRVQFDFQGEKDQFVRVFALLASSVGEGAFVRYRGNTPIGGLAPAYYEAVTIGTHSILDSLSNVRPSDFRRAIADAVQSERFREFTGPGANSRGKLEGRIEVIKEALSGIPV
jgi:hypothetical protein